MNATRTPWFPAHVLPARDGVYERGYGSPVGFARKETPKTVRFCRFERGYWYCFEATAKAASRTKQVSQVHAEWRGLESL